jgi:hypothetical protein
LPRYDDQHKEEVKPFGDPKGGHNAPKGKTIEPIASTDGTVSTQQAVVAARAAGGNTAPIIDRHRRLSDWLGGEPDYPPYFGRDEVAVVAGEEMWTGTILQAAGAGEVQAWVAGQTPVGILISEYIPGETTAPYLAVALMRGPAHIKDMGILWPDGITAQQIEACKVAFAAKQIVFRETA